MLNEFKQFDITPVESIPDNSKNKSGAMGFSRGLLAIQKSILEGYYNYHCLA